MSNSTATVGAYGPFTTELDEQAKIAFSEAIEQIVGVDYVPLAVAKQIVSGTNYAFFCNAKTVAPGATSYPAMVSVYKPLQGGAGVTHIERLQY